MGYGVLTCSRWGWELDDLSFFTLSVQSVAIKVTNSTNKRVKSFSDFFIGFF